MTPPKNGRCGPRLKKALHVRAWWVMREMAVFSLNDLLSTVADGHERSAERNLKGYIRALERSEVLRQVRHAQWSLVRDLGPEAPKPRKGHLRLYDPNSGAFLELHEQITRL